MDKSLLLVLLCLQVFLLITAFISTDAATLVDENGFLKLPPDLKRNAETGVKPQLWLPCWIRPEACDTAIPPPPPTKKPLNFWKRPGGYSSFKVPPSNLNILQFSSKQRNAKHVNLKKTASFTGAPINRSSK